MDSRYKQRHGKEVEEEQSTGTQINNITQIPNRSWYDLQNTPGERYTYSGNGSIDLKTAKGIFARVVYMDEANQDYNGALIINTTRPSVNIEPKILFISNKSSNELEVFGNSDNSIFYSDDKVSKIKPNGSAILINTGVSTGNRTSWMLSGDLKCLFPLRSSVDRVGSVTTLAGRSMDAITRGNYEVFNNSGGTTYSLGLPNAEGEYVFEKDIAIEGCKINSGNLTVKAGDNSGITLLWKPGYQNVIPENGTFKVKFIADNLGVLSGDLIPV